MIIEELVEKAENFNLKEIRKYNPDMEVLNAISSNAALKLAKKYNANENIVRIAVAMMDSKLPEAAHLGVGKEHIKMSAEAAKELLKEADCLDEKQKENIIKCVEQHHGVEKFFSIEAEVVANADCYKFIHPKGVLFYASMLGRRFHEFDKELEQLDYKLNEKHNALSLPMAKEELEPFYEFFQKAINEAKK
jgi:hypothetical protein